MSNLIVDLEDINRYDSKNKVIKLRIIGTIIEFNPKDHYIEIQTITHFSSAPTQIKIELDDDIFPQLINPQFSYVGTNVDCYSLYLNGRITLISIDLFEEELNEELIRSMLSLSSIKDIPL
ncbi:hypothetical protein WICMUC_005726 [Wickerhamomyces mucosus]|uniref:Uncharacterized protein n=1 Tax=Wickerhamomyces mucosus TaxID=1378264 RepID=A0A9P8T403_9ASCO|nr:hypothetical protein WICMUC_005726 [Wickerhamomyces mucosus]